MLDKSEFKFIFFSIVYLIYLVFRFPAMLFSKSAAMPFMAVVIAIAGLAICWKLFTEIKE